MASLPTLVFRQEGNIESLVKSVYQEVDATDMNLEESFLTHKRIAHARWVTHGEPAPRSSHPQSSGAENEFLPFRLHLQVLKQTLIRHGFTFESDTDTEVIPKLVKYLDKSNEDSDNSLCDTTVTFSQVVLEVMRYLDGAYALIFKSQHYPNDLIACKHGSPLLLGVKFLLWVLECLRNAKLDAHQFPIRTGNWSSNMDGGVSILKFDGDKGKRGVLSRPASVQRALSVLDMENKIHEQPESLTTTMRGRLIRGGTCKAKTVLLGGLKDHLKTIRRSWRIVFIGCGTGYNAALAARPIWEELSGIPVTMEIASDLLDRQGPIYREDTAAFVSQSGETADTLHALEYVSRMVHYKYTCGVHINAGAEIDVASTKAYTSQTVVMAMLALAIGGDAISNEVRREAIIDCLFELPNKVREVLKLDQEMKYLAKLLIAEQSLLMFGRGCDYATALEGSLKVKEMKHGPLALVDESLPIVVIATHDACFRTPYCHVPKGDAAAMSLGGACRVIEVPQAEDCLQPVVNIVPLQ
ncbi:hypothetical protein ACJRO7_030643, partial [Eucalyptus globulus]